MMDIGTAANVAEIAGGIAILISLTYAGFQIRQSNQIGKIESIRTTQSNSFVAEFNMATIGRGLVSFESLSYEEKWEFNCYIMRFFSHYGLVVQTRDVGFIDDATVSQWTKVLAETLATPGGQQYWESGGRTSIPPDIARHVDDYVRRNSASIVPYNEQQKWMLEVG